MSSDHLVPPAGGAQDPCERLRQQLGNLATQLNEDVQHLHALENTPGTPGFNSGGVATGDRCGFGRDRSHTAPSA